MSKINFICFHGCGQTNVVFKQLLKNLESKIKKKYDADFHYIQGNFKLKDKGYSWYKENTKNGEYRVNLQEREKQLGLSYFNLQNKTNVILIGFSEGGMYVLDMAMKFCNNENNPIIGVISIAPPYSTDIKYDYQCNIPGMIIVSPQDKNIYVKNSIKWLKHFTNLTKEITDKGHKVHFPLFIRDRIMKLIDDDEQIDVK